MSSSDGGLILRTLVEANVQFVVVGEPDPAAALRLVVSRHPTNLEMLGRALDRLGSSLRRLPEDGDGPEVHRIGDLYGTVAVHTAGGDLDLMFGGAHRSLYADTLERAEAREIDGTTVQWSDVPAPIGPHGRVTSGILGRRLLSIAEGLAHLLERHDDRPDVGGDPRGATGAGPDPAGVERVGPTSSRPPSGSDRVAGGAESGDELGSAG